MAFSYKPYQQSEAVQKAWELLQQNSEYAASEDVIKAQEALQNHEQTKPGEWTGGTYGQVLQEQIDKINNRDPFTYDLASDALYQQYKDQYITGGKYAMMDTMGQAAALTGGYGNSYAATAGNQAYQQYLQQLNNVVPQLYQLALDKYNQEGKDLKDMYSIYADRYNAEYGEHRDNMSDWYTEAGRLSDEYWNQANFDYSKYADYRDYLQSMYGNERDYDYGLYSDEYARAFANYQQQVAEQQYWASYNQRAAQDQDGGEKPKASATQATQTFEASILTRGEFGKRGNRATINGTAQRFDTYEQYVAAMLQSWMSINDANDPKYLTDNEVAYLKARFGL